MASIAESWGLECLRRWLAGEDAALAEWLEGPAPASVEPDSGVDPQAEDVHPFVWGRPNPVAAFP